MSENERTAEEGKADEPGEDENRTTDIEDQGQAINAVGETESDVEAVEGDDSDPGPEGVGAREAIQKSGEAPTEIVEEENDSEND